MRHGPAGEIGPPGVRCPCGSTAIGPTGEPSRLTSVAQLVEHRSPKPAVGGSIPSARARGRIERAVGRFRRAAARDPTRPRCGPDPSRSASHRPRTSDPRLATFPFAKRDRCHGQSQRWSAGVESDEALKGGVRRGTERRLPSSWRTWCETDLYKPMQGWYARLYTASASGVVLAAGPLAALRDA